MSSCRLQEVKNDRKSLNFQAQKVVGVAYRRWSFTRGSNCKALTENLFGVLDKLSLIADGRLREVVAHRGSTVFSGRKNVLRKLLRIPYRRLKAGIFCVLTVFVLLLEF